MATFENIKLKHLVKYLYIIALLISFSCCNNNKAAKPAISQAPLKRSYTSAQQQKVISDINFGISKKQFERQYKKFLKSKKCISGCTIGKFEYFKEYPKFKNDQLYYLEFANVGVKHNGISQLIPEILNDAYHAVRLEYGEPNSSHSLSSWTKGEKFTVYKWKIGEKIIEIVVVRINMDLGVKLLIYKP
jgi:hypothetical protein